jgi:hypothetical protein
MGALLAPERLDEFHSCLIFQNVPVIGRCLVDMNNVAPRVGALHKGPKHKIDISPKTAPVISIKFQSLLEHTPLDKTA